LIEVGYNLATRGVLGSTMFADFAGADSAHMWTLPAQHVLDALSFHLAGGGIAQARWVSIAAAVVTLWSVGWLGLRWFGLAAALGAECLLVLWRSNLTNGDTGVPLLDISRVARYDVLAVGFTWLGLVALTAVRSRRGAFVAGALAGAATLSQFFGVFGVPVLLIGCLRSSSRWRWLLGGAALVVLPWLAFVALHAGDFAIQMSVYGQRGAFTRPQFYLDNVLGEYMRYAHLLSFTSPWSAWLVLLGIGPAIAYAAWKRNWLLFASVLVPAAFLTLLDQTKTPLYAAALVPGVCLSLSAMISEGVWRCPLRWPRLLAIVALAGFSWLLGGEGLRAYAIDAQESTEVTPYLQLGDRIRSALPAEGLVLGPERWWWPVHDRSYISLRSLWFQWTASGGRTPFAQMVARWQPTSIIVNNNVRNDLLAFPIPLQDEFWAYINQCTAPTADIDDPTYFDIQVYRVTPCL
jgi:hypothetical protein